MHHPLTPRERDVLALVAEGRSNLGIATSLGLTTRTVETHTSRIFTKLDLEEDLGAHRRVLAALAHVRSRGGLRLEQIDVARQVAGSRTNSGIDRPVAAW